MLEGRSPAIAGPTRLVLMPNGEDAAATFFSLIETAKANGLEPYSYFRCLFEQLPFVKDQGSYRDLLPQYIDPDLINAERP